MKGATCRGYAAHRMTQPDRRIKDPAKLRTVTAATARRELEDLSAAIGAYHKEYTLDAVPHVTLPEKAERRDRWLTRSEVARLLWACLGWNWDAKTNSLRRTHRERAQTRARRRHLARFILIGIYSGTRHSPIVQARWIESLEAPYVDVARGVLYRRGARERKTNKRQPPVRIVPRLLAHMRRWERLDLARTNADGQKAPATHVVHFLGRPIAGTIRTAWVKACQDAGLGPEVVPHIMRHSAATWLMHGAAPIGEAAGYLGMSEQTLRTHYQHHHPDYQDGMDQAFERARERTGNRPKIAQETHETRRTKRGETKGQG
ncbi:tyrosine-type recombinase/integrase [Aureimonas mangrovi]|uniref:tyrosine-type recombinase/integrase n=1 Tax=Aureimonas mangrovi TaxID=2758041 RepID=UPI00163DC348|nr:tyrosine-type recombinase/integrase [Aureimonas mangrovi]